MYHTVSLLLHFITKGMAGFNTSLVYLCGGAACSREKWR